uniref:Ribosomal protein L10 n=1 Tax=Triglochin maritima TaxID=55501 RepID=A0A1Z1R0E2_9LILI|nr:ribosomal protein L10 [Triglochin maritima]
MTIRNQRFSLLKQPISSTLNQHLIDYRLSRVSGEERSPEIPVSFHSSGSTSNQWRKLKNPWFPGRTPFRPAGKKKRFFAGPTCILYLAEEASDRLGVLPSWDSMDQDLLSLYGQYRSTLVDHMDVEKASDLEELETSLFHFHLPSSYLCFVCSRYSNEPLISTSRRGSGYHLRE